MATTTPNYGWVVPTSTDLVKDGATAIETLGDSADATVKALNPETTLGDIAYRSATANTNTRLAIGSTGNVLTVAGGVPTWAAPAAAGSGFTFIQRSTFSNVATADMNDIFSSTYETYAIVIESAFTTNNTDDLQMQFNYAGPNTQTATYYGRNTDLNATYDSSYINNANQATIIRDIRSSADQASNGIIYINNVGNGSRNPMGYLYGFSAANLAPNASSIYQATARVYTGLRFNTSGGNLTANISVYGLAKA